MCMRPSINLHKASLPSVSQRKRVERAQQRKQVAHEHEAQWLIAYSELCAEEEGFCLYANSIICISFCSVCECMHMPTTCMCCIC